MLLATESLLKWPSGLSLLIRGKSRLPFCHIHDFYRSCILPDYQNNYFKIR